MVPLIYEKKKFREGYSFVIGTDEVGRGCLAGPVVAAAVVFNNRLRIPDARFKLEAVQDSKLLSPGQRELLVPKIKEFAVAWSVGVVSSSIIDQVNIHHASLRAMRVAVGKALRDIWQESSSSVSSSRMRGSSIDRQSITEVFRGTEPMDSRLHRNDTNTFLFVDGKFLVPNIAINQQAVVDGDAKIFGVACASIIAKVYRDNLMRKLHVKLPHYNFAQHKGYATLEHRKAILTHGLSKYHRRSFCGKYMYKLTQDEIC